MDTSRHLLDLLEADQFDLTGDKAVRVTGVAYDSRRVEPGFVFVAVPGFVQDGLDFVPEAVARGAIAIVSESRPLDTAAVAWIRVTSARRALAGLAANWYEHPSRALRVAGVTGTNGKTTVTALLEMMLAEDMPSGRWSTTQVRIAGRSAPTPRTTPEALELQAALAEMVEAGCGSAVIEVSSHALRLHRTTGTTFAAATFTNLSPDHLDFHDGMDDYFDAKATLFARLAADAPAVINLSDPRGAELTTRTTGRPVGYGWADDSDAPYTIRSFVAAGKGSRMTFATPDGELELRTPLFGRANAENLAAAAATALELGASQARVVAVASQFAGEPGRLQRVEVGQPFTVLVDFAHTPGALEAALQAARSTAMVGRVIVAFGCGGDRDRGKRPLMGAAAAAAADVVIITSDNPRSEDPDAIIEDVIAGISRAQVEELFVEPDRALAIRRALGLAEPGDCVVIAGKGHETTQVFAGRTVPFDDVRVTKQSLAQLGAAP